MLIVLAVFVVGCKSISRASRDCRVCGAALFSAGPSEFDADSLDSSAKIFHHYGVHASAEGYLVRLEQIERTGGAKNERKFNATILDCIVGSRTAGETIVFTRVSDASPDQIEHSTSEMKGNLYYVFLSSGAPRVDLQDPNALWKCTDELRELVQRHKNECRPNP